MYITLLGGLKLQRLVCEHSSRERPRAQVLLSQRRPLHLYTSLAARSGSGRNRSTLGRHISIINFIISLAIRQCAARSSTWITPSYNFPERRKPRKTKRNRRKQSTSLFVDSDKKKIGGCYGRNVDVFFFLANIYFLE